MDARVSNIHTDNLKSIIGKETKLLTNRLEELGETNSLLNEPSFNKTLNDFVRVTKGLTCCSKEDEKVLQAQQLKLVRELRSMTYTPKDKVNLYLAGRADELPPDGNGKDEICGTLLPTDEEVFIGMYPRRELYYFRPYTCGVYMFYTEDMRFRYIGKSQYIEYALHSHFCRWRSQRALKIEGKKFLIPVRYMLDTCPEKLRFAILERVPLSLLKIAERNQRIKYKCLYQYDVGKNKWTPEKWLAGKLDY